MWSPRSLLLTHSCHSSLEIGGKTHCWNSEPLATHNVVSYTAQLLKAANSAANSGTAPGMVKATSRWYGGTKGPCKHRGFRDVGVTPQFSSIFGGFSIRNHHFLEDFPSETTIFWRIFHHKPSSYQRERVH